MADLTADSNNNGDHAALSGARRVVLARRHPDTAGPDDRTVHLIPLPISAGTSTASALCGTRMHPDQIQTVTPGAGVWCTMCVVCHVTGSPPAPDADRATLAEDESAETDYRVLGWPVILRGDQVSLNLDAEVVALVIPALLGTEVAEILVRRRCPPPVLAHPSLPAHRIIL